MRILQEMGSVFDDDDSAFETQPQTRPDGSRFYVVFNTENTTTGVSDANSINGSVGQVPDPVAPAATADSGSRCALGNGRAPFGPTPWRLAGLGLMGLGLRRMR